MDLQLLYLTSFISLSLEGSAVHVELSSKWIESVIYLYFHHVC